MTIENLITKYSDFIVLINDTRIVSNLSIQVFDRYPENIPHKIYKPIKDSLDFAAKKLIVLDYDHQSEVEESMSAEDVEKIKQSPKISGIFVESSMAKAIPQLLALKEVPTVENPKELKLYSSFSKIILEQEFLSYYAFFDAYIGNILTMILKKYPKKLNPRNLPKNESREIRWDDILKFDNYDDLTEFMIEKYNYSFGYKSLFERLNTFQSKEFGFKIPHLKQLKSYLDEIEEIRNCIIHKSASVQDTSGSYFV